MPGGLIQLLTIGLQDAPLVLNPEITFFKTIYRKHTNFSIEQIIKNIGTKKFNTFHQFKINTVSDLLVGLHFIIDIPYFDVVKNVTTKTTTTNYYEINELSVNYDKVKTYLFFESTSSHYYLIPETFFNLSENDNYYNQVFGTDLENNLLANLNLLSTQDYGILVDIFQLKDSKLNQVLPILRLNFSKWAEFWLKIMDSQITSYNFNYFTNIVSQLSIVQDLRKKLELILFDGYVNYNVFEENSKYMNFKNEIIDFITYNTKMITNPIYDTDFAINYAISNTLNIDTYKLNALKFNSLFYLFILQSLYPVFTTRVKTFTFWKKYQLGLNNIVDSTVIISSNNYFLEWNKRFNFYKETSYGNYEKLELEIYETFLKKYSLCEQNILYLFNSIQINNKEKIWCILKSFYNQFTDNNTNKICFDDHFSTGSSAIYLNNTIENLFQNTYSTLLTKSNLNATWSTFDDPSYIQPVDLATIYPYLAYKYIDIIINANDFNDYHFMIMWRNKITIAIFFRLANNLDNYNLEKTEDNSLQNTFLELNDSGQTNKRLTFYHNINLNRNIKLDNIRNEMNNLFFSDSFYGTIDISTNNLLDNLILISPTYTGLNDISYNMVNQYVEIIDEFIIGNSTYTYTNNIIEITNWNNSIYNKIFIEINSIFIECKNFIFKNNSLFIYPDTVLTLISNIKLKMVKELYIPVINFNAEINSDGNVNYANMNFNVQKYPDTSFNMIDYPDISYNIINLFNTDENNIITINEIYNNTITLNIDYTYSNLYELKVLNSDLSVERIEIIIDSSNNILTPINLDLTKIKKIDLIEYNFNLEFNTSSAIILSNNQIDTHLITIDPNCFYWLLSYMDLSNNLLKNKVFLPVINKGSNLYAIGDTSNLLFTLVKVKSPLVPNLFSILHHNLNQDESGNIMNFQFNAHFYQQPYILNTFHKFLSKNNEDILLDSSGNMIDELNRRLNSLLDKILINIDTQIEYPYTIDSSGNYVDNDNGYIIVQDPSGSTNFVLQDTNNDLAIVVNSITGEIIYLNYLYGNGLYYISNKSVEPLYYFYNFPINERTKSITINGRNVNRLFQINPSEFYIKDNISYPPIFEPLKMKQANIIPNLKKSIINKYNQLFDTIFLEDLNFSPILNIIENADDLYQDLNVNGIKLLKTMGKTISTIIDNSHLINNLNLENYQSYDYKNNSLFAPYYYNLSNTFISSGIAIQKFKIAAKGYILTQPKQIFESSTKISTNLYNYLNSVASVLIKNINYVNDYQDLEDSLNENEYINSFLPRFQLENNVNKILYTPTTYKIETLFDLSGYYSDSNTEIYLNNLLIDISSNNITTNENMFEISEEILYNNEIIYQRYNNFDNEKFNYIGPVYFSEGSFIFNNTYNFINDISNTYLLLDDLKVVKFLDIKQEDFRIKTFYNSYEGIFQNFLNFNKNEETNYVYSLDIDISNNVDLSNNLIIGDSVIINFNFYLLKIVGSSYVIIGKTPLDFRNRYLISGFSQANNIESFLPANFYIVKNIRMHTNFKSKMQTSNIIKDDIFIKKDNNYILLDSIITNTDTYFSYNDYTEDIVTTYKFINKQSMPPFRIIKTALINNIYTNPIKLITEQKDFVLNNYTKLNYYKLDNQIFTGSQLENSNISGNYNLWIYPQNNLKLIPTGYTGSITNKILNLSSIANLPNYTYYYLNGTIFFINLISNDYSVDLNNIPSTDLYFLADDNFIKVEEQYISIIDNNSIEFICPDIDTSSNYYEKDVRINSYYYFDFKNKDDDVFKNELDIIGAFKDASNNNFMLPFSYNYVIESITALVYVYHDSANYPDQNYNNFLFYKTETIDNNGFVNGRLYSDLFKNNIYTYITCYQSDFIITKVNNVYTFKVKASSGFEKYKLWFGLQQGDSIINKFSYIWILQISNTNNSYYSIFNMQQPASIGQTFYPFNVYQNNILGRDINMFEINNGYSLLGNDQLISLNNKYIYFNNYFENRSRQQVYYHSNVLYNKNLLAKLEYNYDTTIDYFPILDNLGVIDKINGNLIYKDFSEISNNLLINLKYLILIGKENKYFCLINTVDLSNGIININTEIKNNLNEIYTMYASDRDLIFTLNEINIYFNENTYKITSYKKNCLRINDIIMIGDNIFEILGLNSITMFYDVKPIKITQLKSNYSGYYYLYRYNSIPIIPEFENVVEFTINNTNNYKMLIDVSFNTMVFGVEDLSSNRPSFSIAENDTIYLYVKNNKLYNPYNYILRKNDYLIINTSVLSIKYIKNGIIYINSINGTPNLSNYNEGFHVFYFPYQPFKMENLSFDSSGNLINKLDSSGNLINKLNNFYFEQNSIFRNINNLNNITKSNLANSLLFTRILMFPYQNLYFENKSILPLDADLSGNILIFKNPNINLTAQDLFYNQNILINSSINYIIGVILPNKIIVNNLNYPLAATSVKVVLGKRSDQILSCNYILDKCNYLRPIINLNSYHYYDISNEKILNYDVSNQYIENPNKVIFKDNIICSDVSNNMLNLIDSYHILLEKTKFNQYISYLCKIKLPNKLLIIGTVQSYESEFYIDKIHLINLNIDNTFNYNDMRIIKQFILSKLPQNEIVIWKKYNLVLNGLVENIENGFQVEIDITNILYNANSIYYLDKTIPCIIILSDGKYYLQTKDFIDNVNYLYTKHINYLKKSKKSLYTTNININPIYEKDFGLESIQIPVELNLRSSIDYNYYTIENDISYLVKDGINISAGNLNLNVVSTYIDQVSMKRTLTTNDIIISSELNKIYFNNFKTNIFDEETIYLDSEGSLLNIFNDTNFKLSTLFNPIKSWNTWSLVTNPDITKDVLIKGNLQMDVSGNISLDSSNNYYTKSEIRDLSGFLYFLKKNNNFPMFLDLLYFQNTFYENLPNFIRYDSFWLNPIKYINNFLRDIDLNIIFTGTKLLFDNIPLDNLVINNQFIVIETNNTFKIVRDITLVSNEIFNIVNNISNNILYGVTIYGVLNHIITLSQQFINLKSTIKNFIGKPKNFGDLLLYIFKSKLGEAIDFRAMNNFSSLGLDVLTNLITYDSGYDTVEFLKDYPLNATEHMLNINIPYNLNYTVDTSSGLYPYAIFLQDETYSSHTVYKIDFLEGEKILNKISVDNPLIFNNQIEFYSKSNFDINHNFSIDAFKPYNISSTKFIGYVYTIDMSSQDLSSIDFNLFLTIKYKNVELFTYDTYLVFPNYIETLNSYIQAESNVGVDTYDISGNYTNIELLKINQVFNAQSQDYTIYFSSDNKFYRVVNINDKKFTVQGKLTKFKDTKIILTIKSTSIIYKNLVLYNLNLAEPLINYQYYFDLKNVPKNFYINDEVKVNDLKFIGDDVIEVLLNSIDISTNFVFQNIVHYSKIGEYPPEPIQLMEKMDSFLFEFNDVPPINDITSCFIYYDINYNSHENSDVFIQNFINNITGYNIIMSNDVIKFSYKTQMVCNKFIADADINYHTFGGVLNKWNINKYTYVNGVLKFDMPDLFIFNSKYSYLINNIFVDISNFFINGISLEITTNIIIIESFLFTQVIIEKVIEKPINNQLCSIELFDPIDIRYDGYIQTLNNDGDEIGQYIYLANIKSDYKPIQYNNTDSLIYLEDTTLYEGQILNFVSPQIVYGRAIAIGTSFNIYYSDNYINWFPVIYSPLLNPIVDIIYVNSNFIAVGRSGTNYLMTSSNGLNWINNESIKPFFTSSYTGGIVTALATNGEIICTLCNSVENINPSFILYTKDNCISWQRCIFTNTYFVLNVIKTNGTIWVAGGLNTNISWANGYQNTFVWSEDGITWNTGSIDYTPQGGGISYIYWNKVLSVWFAIVNSTGITYGSKDGKSWYTNKFNSSDLIPINFGMNTVKCIDYNNSYWLVIGTDLSNNNVIKKSTNFTDWLVINQNATTFMNNFTTLEWSGSKWILGGLSNTLTSTNLIYSTDSIIWYSTINTEPISNIIASYSYTNEMYLVTNQSLDNINFIIINESQLKFPVVSTTLVQYSYISFTIYRKISLGNYLIFIDEQAFNFLDTFNFQLENINKFYLISKFAQFKLDKKFANQKITPSDQLTNTSTTVKNLIVYTEPAVFKPDLYKRFFEYIDFYIGDQLVEQLNKNVMDIQYQFLKDDNKRSQLDKLVKPYHYNNGIRFIVPLEFWFNCDSTQSLPLICLTYTLISLKFKISEIKELLLNINYESKDLPELNIQINIDGIMLDTIERELFGNLQHEYMIERFKTYPDSLIASVNSISRMKFKNMVKDVFFATEIISTSEPTYSEYKPMKDYWTIYYENKRALYNEYLITGVYTDKIGKENAFDFDVIKKAISDVQINAERCAYFKQSVILSKFEIYNMEYLLFLDGKYQYKFPSLQKRRSNLELYCVKLFKNYEIQIIINPILTLNIQSSGTDLFVPLKSSYFDTVVPYERYNTSVDSGFLAYSFSLHPLEKQPSGHINFTMLDDIVINTVNDSRCIEDPFLLKTSVREYQILRIMSGMGALAWMD